MKASFFEYQVAMSGLFTARANLNVVSHNTANAGIPGYSRQYTIQKASTPLTLQDGRGMYGTGSEVLGIANIRDFYLDRKYWHQRNVLGEYATKNAQLAQVETVFNDLSETGVGASFSDFFKRLQDLTTNAPDATYRTNVVTAAETLAELVRTNAQALQKQQRDINNEVEGLVSQINSLGTQIASLSNQINQYERDGSNANDLRDQRALLVDKLSEYVNVSVEERDLSSSNNPNDRRYSVMINGYDFVNNDRVNTLVCVPRDNITSVVSTTGGDPIESGVKRNEMDVDGLYDICFADTGSSFNIYSSTLKGTLKGLIDTRDGNNGDPTMPVDAKNLTTTKYKGIPFYMNKLNALIRTVAKAFNEGLDAEDKKIPGVWGHLNGFDLNGNTGQQLFFTYGQGTGGVEDLYDYDPATGIRVPINNSYKEAYSLINCLNFSVNPQLKDPELLATATTATIGESNNDVIHGFNKINSYESLFREGKLQDFIIGTSDHLSIDRMQARSFEVSYYEITMATDNQRISVSGVDINEEMVAMVRYEQLYQACAKLVNIIDSIYDTMINRLGNF